MRLAQIYSIFSSINGEVCNPGQGSFCTFIRFAGCNLRCKWCDTEYALDKDAGKEMSIDQILNEVHRIGIKNVTITGGEPLMQMDALKELVKELWARHYWISIETNGSIELPWFEGVVFWVYDIKPQSAGVGAIHNHPNNKEYQRFKEHDWVKFVIADRTDFDDAVKYYKGMVEADCRARFAFSPMTETLDTNKLVEWMRESKLFDVVVNTQLHKIIDLSEPN